MRATFVRLSCPEKQAKRNMLQINFQVGQGPGSAPGGSLGNLGKKGKALGNTGGLKHGCGSLGSCFDLEPKPMRVGCGGWVAMVQIGEQRTLGKTKPWYRTSAVELGLRSDPGEK